MISVLTISCGTIDLPQFCCDNITTNGLSNYDLMKYGSPTSQTVPTYMREGVTNTSMSHPFVHGSWKYVWWHYLSKSKRKTYPIVSVSFVTCIIGNLPKRPLKVTPRYTYDPTTSTCPLESIR